MDISEKIISIRKASGLTQEQFGRVLGVSRQAVSKWENKETKPDTEYIIKIAKEFNISTDYLLLDATDKKQSTFSPETIARKNLRFKFGVLLIVLGIFYHLFLKKNTGQASPVYILGLEFSGYLAWAFRKPLYGTAIILSLLLIATGIIICLLQVFDIKSK